VPFDGRIVEYRSLESSAAPFLDTVTVEGEVVVPVDLVNIGH
jgi:hypothetical protein